MTQFIQILGKDYVVWDKAASVNFKKPIRKTVYARFLLTQEFIDEVKAEVAQNGKHVFDLPVHYQDKDGTVYAEISKTLYVASKDYYNKKP